MLSLPDLFSYCFFCFQFTYGTSPAAGGASVAFADRFYYRTDQLENHASKGKGYDKTDNDILNRHISEE